MKHKFKDKLMKALVMILSVGTLWLTTGNVSLAYTVDDAIPQWDEPGSLRLSKTAIPTDKDDEWKIELTVEGKDYPTTTDVVLVVDTSNSMNYDMSGKETNDSSKTRLQYVKTAAVQFAENILTEENATTHRMAIVTFAPNSSVVCDFTTSTTTLKQYINNIKANGGTNMQAGLYQAKNLLKKSTADNKVIVILGDGMPTYCYEISSSKGISIDHETHTPVFETGYTLTYNTEKYIGKGSASDYKNLYTLLCAECGKSYAVYNDVIEPTLYESDTIKKSNIEIYSIAFGADSVGTSTLKSISSNTSETNSFFTGISSSVSQSQVQEVLNDTFEHIASSILSAAKDSVVTDPMGEMFDLVAPNGAADITVAITDTKTQTTETFKGSDNDLVEISGTTLQWKIGTVAEGKIYKLSYIVQIKDTAESGKYYPTNGTTTLQYIDYKGEKSSRDFEVPQVCIYRGSIKVYCYLSDNSGTPLNNDGQAVSSPQEAYIFDSYDYGKRNETVIRLGQAYDVQAEIFDNTNFIGSYGDMQAWTSSQTVTVTPSKEVPNQTVYFAYTLQNGTLTIQKSGDLLPDETALFMIADTNGNISYETIQGSGSKTLKGLTLGEEYTVTEMTDWSWKYELKSSNPQRIRISNGKNIAAFENKGSSSYLTDESFASNVFNPIEMSA